MRNMEPSRQAASYEWLLRKRTFLLCTSVRKMQARQHSPVPKRIISYARVSTDAQASSGLGIEAQHRAVQAAAVERGWQIVGHCTDDAVSAGIEPRHRPQLAVALAQLEAGEADALVAVRLDRFARRTRDLQNLLDLAADKAARRIIERGIRAGLEFPAGARPLTVPEQFESELGGL